MAEQKELFDKKTAGQTAKQKALKTKPSRAEVARRLQAIPKVEYELVGKQGELFTSKGYPTQAATGRTNTPRQLPLFTGKSAGGPVSRPQTSTGAASAAKETPKTVEKRRQIQYRLFDEDGNASKRALARSTSRDFVLVDTGEQQVSRAKGVSVRRPVYPISVVDVPQTTTTTSRLGQLARGAGSLLKSGVKLARANPWGMALTALPLIYDAVKSSIEDADVRRAPSVQHDIEWEVSNLRNRHPAPDAVRPAYVTETASQVLGFEPTQRIAPPVMRAAPVSRVRPQTLHTSRPVSAPVARTPQPAYRGDVTAVELTTTLPREHWDYQPPVNTVTLGDNPNVDEESLVRAYNYVNEQLGLNMVPPLPDTYNAAPLDDYMEPYYP